MKRKFHLLLASMLFVEVALATENEQVKGRFAELGNHHFRVTTRSATAQRAFDRGLTLAYAFSHSRAEKEFRTAAEADPSCAMAWWGIALVNGPHINFPIVPPENAKIAWDALRKAQRLAPQTSPLEQALIGALSKRYANPQPADRSRLDKAYAAAMRQVWIAHPRNADVGTLYAESLMDLGPPCASAKGAHRLPESRRARSARLDKRKQPGVRSPGHCLSCPGWRIRRPSRAIS
jgi:hypothetical protein